MSNSEQLTKSINMCLSRNGKRLKYTNDEYITGLPTDVCCCSVMCTIVLFCD